MARQQQWVLWSCSSELAAHTQEGICSLCFFLLFSLLRKTLNYYLCLLHNACHYTLNSNWAVSRSKQLCSAARKPRCVSSSQLPGCGTESTGSFWCFFGDHQIPLEYLLNWLVRHISDSVGLPEALGKWLLRPVGKADDAWSQKFGSLWLDFSSLLLPSCGGITVNLTCSQARTQRRDWLVCLNAVSVHFCSDLQYPPVLLLHLPAPTCSYDPVLFAFSAVRGSSRKWL